MTAKLTILAIATKQEKILNQVGEEVKKLVNKVHKGIFHKNIEISILTTKKNSKVNTSLGSHRKNQTRKDRTNKNTHTHTHTHQYEQKCQSHTCSGTINSMYDNDLTTTTPALTSSAPYSG
jgi:ABC-type Zn2+ transport system substrate-binding protein/surface adhesin